MLPNEATELSRVGLSVRAMNVCLHLGCKTVGELALLFKLKGEDFVRGTRNCGKKTLAELSTLAEIAKDPHRDLIGGSVLELDPNNHRLVFTAKTLLDAVDRIKLPLGLPLALVKLPVRIRNLCISRDWRTLGAFIENVGAMSLLDLLGLDNIGKKSATEVFCFFEAIIAVRPADLRNFLPLAPNSTSLSPTEALTDLVVSLDARDIRILELRLIQGVRLEGIARNFDCTRELIRQIEERFLLNVDCILNWFSDERIKLWQFWETKKNLTPFLSEAGLEFHIELTAAAISSVFQNTSEGKLLEEHWRDTFRMWGRELLSSESLYSGGINIVDFVRDRGSEGLSARFESWLANHFGDEKLSIVEGRVTRSNRDLTLAQRTLLYGGEINEMRKREMYERLKQYHAEYGNANVPHRWKADPQLATWVVNQRDRRKRGVMSEEEVLLLDELGLKWQSRDVGTWEDRLAEVLAFKATHGHCDIPLNYPQNLKLGRFINSMRTQKNRGALSAERIAKLDAIGFCWASPRKETVEFGDQIVRKSWKTRFDELAAYKLQHCHRAEQNQPGVSDSKPATLRGGFHNRFVFCFKGF